VRATVVAALLLLASSAFAQDNPDGGTPDGGPPACPPCNCNVTVAPGQPPPLPPPPATEDLSRLNSGAMPIVVGDGSPPHPILDGPFIITTLGSDCFVRYWVSGPQGSVEVAAPVARLFVPDGTTLEVGDAGGLCTGTVYWSGYRP
jgi:hypothetical protein